MGEMADSLFSFSFFFLKQKALLHNSVQPFFASIRLLGNPTIFFNSFSFFLKSIEKWRIQGVDGCFSKVRWESTDFVWFLSCSVFGHRTRRRTGGGRDEWDTQLSGSLKKNLASAQSVMMMGETEKLRGEGKGKRALITTGWTSITRADASGQTWESTAKTRSVIPAARRSGLSFTWVFDVGTTPSVYMCLYVNGFHITYACVCSHSAATSGW